MSNQHSALLINEEPLQVLPSLALAVARAADAFNAPLPKADHVKATGLNEALVLQQIHYWLRKPKVGVVRGGRKWVYNSFPEWHEQFPFWSERTVVRAFKALRRLGLIDTNQPGGRDRRLWVAINYDRVNALAAGLDQDSPPPPPDTHTPSEFPSPSRHGGVMHHDKVSLSDTLDCHDASRQIVMMEDDELSSSSRQSGTVINKVSETTSKTTKDYTHTPPAPESGGDARARVSDDLTLKDYREFARAHSSFTAPDAWATTHYDLRDRDELVREWKEKRDLTLAGTPPVQPKLTPFHAAAQAVYSVSQVPGYDVAGFIDQMQGITDETREQLRERFLTAGAAGGPT